MLDEIKKFLKDPNKIQLSRESINKIKSARQTVLKIIEDGKVAYGINTGFGKLSQVNIPEEKLGELQTNLLRSHACGVDEPVSNDIVALMMFLKIHNLSEGYSGCSLQVVEKLVELLNKKIYPVVLKKGSIGASGDLAPLAHLSLPLIGEGEVFYKGARIQADELVKSGIYKPVQLGAKDGLSLINGTQYSTALLVQAFFKAKDLILMAELAAAMSVEADLATDVPFREEIHNIRHQKGQKKTAKHIRNFLSGSDIIKSHKSCKKVQDPYCYRCLPQVLGMAWDTLDFVENILENEVQAVTDNPLVFSEIGEIVSGGNFHAEPLALSADYLSIAITELGNISERRIANLTDASMSGLPPFLVESSGLNSGFMIAHVTAGALTAENRTLANPASVETVSTSANQEDHVSMAPNAGIKLLTILENTERIVWIEMLAAAQGIDFRCPLISGKGTNQGYRKVRTLVKFLDNDRIMYPDLAKSDELFHDDKFIAKIEKIAT